MAVDNVARGMAAAAMGGGGGGSSTLVGLTDVDISNPTDGQTLVYNATSGKWENGQGSSGGGVLVVNDTDGTLDKTWQEIHDADFAVIKGSSPVGVQDLTQPVIAAYEYDGGYYVACITYINDSTNVNEYYADSPTAYPTYD